MRICEATNLRINELRQKRRLTEYALSEIINYPRKLSKPPA